MIVEEQPIIIEQNNMEFEQLTEDKYYEKNYMNFYYEEQSNQEEEKESEMTNYISYIFSDNEENNFMNEMRKINEEMILDIDGNENENDNNMKSNFNANIMIGKKRKIKK